jgi:hypothetical protein
MDSKKILAIGEGAQDLARDLYGQNEIETTTLTPGKKRTDYDAILSYMALPRVPFRSVEEVAKTWMDALKVGGEMVIFVPSLEWAAVQVLTPSGERNPALILHLFGAQNKPTEYYSCGFTMMDLRSLCTKIGLAVTHASTGEYMLGDHSCECHTVRGIKKPTGYAAL